MPNAFRLAATDPKHGSWLFSVTKKSVYIMAYDDTEARALAAGSLYREEFIRQPGKYAEKSYPPSPWHLPEVTSCELDTSELPRDGMHIVAEDGQKWPIKRLDPSAL